MKNLKISKLDLRIIIFINCFFAALFFLTMCMALFAKFYSMFIPSGFFFACWFIVYKKSVNEIIEKMS